MAAWADESASAVHSTPAEQPYRLIEQHLHAGRLAEASALVQQALNADPANPRAIHYSGLIAYHRGQTQQAFNAVERSVALAPGVALYHSNLGEMYRMAGRHELAVRCGERATALEPQNAQLLNSLGVAHYECGDHEKAIGCYRHAVLLDHRNGNAFNNLGNALKELGRLGEASEAYSRALRLLPEAAAIYFSYADTVTFAADDPHLARMEEMKSSSGSLSDADRLHVDFALAKAYADMGEHERSFQHLLSGNALKRGLIRHDEAADGVLIEKIKAVFSAQLMAEKQRRVDQARSPTPIFIIGMPRSGSTLVEQILASHPAVHAGGETDAFYRTAAALRQATGGIVSYPDFVPTLNVALLDEIAAHYLSMQHKAVEVSHVTDKRLANYYFAGLIHLTFPQASIIRCVRDPLDTCVSCFSKLFAAGQNHYTYDLAELGRQYRRYDRLMAHWRHVLPEGRMLDVRYEDVIGDIEGQARRVVAYCGLEWNADCLKFQMANRPVKTASAAQVRRPLYRDALGRARPYEAFLKPLREALASA